LEAPSREGAVGTVERIRHLREAAENLEAAGMHVLARQLTEQATALQREIAEPRRGGEEAAGRGDLQDLRAQVERLRSEIERLRDELAAQRRPGDRRD
jgi:chromosome segregation ATPase